MPCMQSNALFPIIEVRNLDLIDGTTESPPGVPHKCTNTLMSPQEYEIARWSPNQLEMKTNFPALASEQCPIPHHTGQLAWLPLGNSRDSLRHPTQVYWNTYFSTGTRAKLHAHNIVSRRELIQKGSVKEVCHLHTSTSRGAFSQQSVCEWDPEFAASRAVDTKIP